MAGSVRGGDGDVYSFLTNLDKHGELQRGLKGSRNMLRSRGQSKALRLYLTFNKADTTHVATADYRDVAGDTGGRKVCGTAQANGERGAIKQTSLSPDPVCLCEFMATV